MTDEAPQMTHEEALDALERLRRRERRNRRDAHAKGLLQGICSMLKPGDVVLDCGANIGKVSAQLAQTGATVHAFEPDPYAFGELQKCLAGCDNVVLHNAAVGVEDGAIKLMRAQNFDDNPRGASVKSTVVQGGRMIDEDGEQAIDVPQVSLIGLIRELTTRHGEIAFLKMDIEGAELDILERMLQERLFDGIRLTVAETHEHKFKALRPRFKALRRAVAEDYSPTRVNLDWI
ncbi:MAG: FkbM family methyltransferase [Rhodobacteraceae bacterium]|nr:FkbM family methyltransferase [Paracoccaceae bacterium]